MAVAAAPKKEITPAKREVKKSEPPKNPGPLSTTDSLFDNLPDELILQIFSHLHSIQELGRMSATNIR